MKNTVMMLPEIAEVLNVEESVVVGSLLVLGYIELVVDEDTEEISFQLTKLGDKAGAIDNGTIYFPISIMGNKGFVDLIHYEDK